MTANPIMSSVPFWFAFLLFLNASSASAQNFTVESSPGCPQITLTEEITTTAALNVLIDWDSTKPGTKSFDINMNIGSASGWDMEVRWQADDLTEQETVMKRVLSSPNSSSAVLIAESVLEGPNHTLKQVGEILLNNEDRAFLDSVPLVILMQSPESGDSFNIVVTLNDLKVLCLPQQIDFVSRNFNPKLMILGTLSTIDSLLESNAAKDSQVVSFQNSVNELLAQNATLNKTVGSCSDATIALDIALNAEKQKVLACEAENGDVAAALGASGDRMIEASKRLSKMQSLVKREGRNVSGLPWVRKIRKQMKQVRGLLAGRAFQRHQ